MKGTDSALLITVKTELLKESNFLPTELYNEIQCNVRYAIV